MASTESPVEPQISIPGCQILSHLDSPTLNDTGYPQVSRFASTRTTSDKTTSFPRGRHPSRRRPSLIADDVLPIGILENASVAGQLLNDTSDSRISNRRSLSCATATSNTMAVEKVQRWSGMTRTVSDWDGLRRDSELWVQDGDCYVHLYAQGASRRGPSFCVPFRALRQKKCNSMLNVCHAQIASRDGSEAQPLMSLSSSLILPSRELGVVNLYIPVPEGIARQDSFKWHVTTRNFFAFLLGKPLVGYHMGQTFVDLQERLHLFRSGLIDNHQDFLQYAEDQGYHDFAECTDYALACLFYAETYKLRQAWIDAFAHCVGMNESLSLSPEYANISRLTKALITRAFLEVDIHLGQVTVALSKFLEDDLSPTYLGLTPGARSHLNRFRRFLHGFYVKKFGYWPPPRGSAFPKALYKSMYFDFQNLYDYLVDTNSTTDFALQGPASGGICVLQNVDSFDKRHKFTSQPHPLPLVPSYTEPTKKMESQKALRQLTLANQHNKANGVQSISSSLTAATNLQDPAVVNSNIVQEYAHFERTYSSTLNQKDEKVSVVDARKVRWLLIYGTLQYLVSALRAPKEVRDSETPDYPLCCLLPEQSSWPGSSQVSTPSASSPVSASASTVNVPQAIDEYLSSSQSDFTSIQPDCHREDYFSSRTSSQRGSVEVPAPLRLSTPVSYPPTRTFGSISLSGRSSRRSSVKLKPNHHCEIIVHGYGNGLNEATTGSPTQGLSRSASVNDSNRSSTSILPEGAGPETSWIRPKSPPIPPERTSSKTRRHARTRTPLFTADQLKNFFPSPVSDTDMSRSDSTSSHGSQVWSETSAISSESSADGDYKERHSTTVEDSGLLGGFVSVDSTPVPTPRTRSLSKSKAPASQSSPPPTTHMQAFRFDDDAPQTPNYDHIHPAFRPPTADTTIGLALSPQVSPPLSPSINLQSSYFDPVLAAPKNTPSHSLSRSSELTYADLPISKIPSRRASHREHGLFTTISSSSKEAEKRASSERTKNRMSILKKFYAF